MSHSAVADAHLTHGPMKPTVAPPPPSSVSAGLLSAALTGLLIGVGACSSENQDEHDHLGAGTQLGVVLSEVEDKTMTYTKFTDECAKRDGLVQTHAVCFGNNSCKGMSYNKFDFKLMEHTCKALNSCGGMSCVVLPVDQGRTGAAIYAGDDSCSGCHGTDDFTLFVRPGTDVTKAMADFPTKPLAKLSAIVAFGVRGYSANGVSEAFMPGHHEKYSLAEIQRTIDYVRTLPLKVEEYGILGVTEDVNPE